MECNNYRLVTNTPVLAKVVESVVVKQLKVFLEEADYLDLLRSGFKPDFGTESALVALMNDHCPERDFSIFQQLLVLFVYHCILLD